MRSLGKFEAMSRETVGPLLAVEPRETAAASKKLLQGPCIVGIATSRSMLRARTAILMALTLSAVATTGCGLISFLFLPKDCVEDADCGAGDECQNNVCTTGFSCMADADCADGYFCFEEMCAALVPQPGEMIPDDEDDPNVYTCACTCDGPGQGQGQHLSIVLDVCMPADLNPNVDGASSPSDADLDYDCSGRVADNIQAMSRTCVNDNMDCACNAIVGGVPPERFFRDECNGDCPSEELAADCSNWDPRNGIKDASYAGGNDPVCVTQTSDPPAPIPDPLSAFIYGRNSLCEVSGSAAVAIGHGEEETPAAGGRVHLWGDPCPDASCSVGIAYQTTIDDFTIGGFFGFGATDVKELSFGGASLPGIVALDSSGLGVIGAGDARSSGRGRSVNPLFFVDEDQAVGSFSSARMDVAVDWDGQICGLGGTLAGAAGDDEETDSFNVDVALLGTLVNQPPTAVAGSYPPFECTSPGGAQVSLDASGSTDPDGNLVLYQWRKDSRAGTQLGNAEPLVMTPQVLGDRDYFLKVVDAGFQADEDWVAVTVEDTTAPTAMCPGDVMRECNEATDPDSTGVGTSSDVCDDSPDVDFADVAAAGQCPQEMTITRTWTATDDSGNQDSCDQTIHVVDSTAPTAMCPADVTRECDEPTDPGSTGVGTSSDVCDDSPDVDPADVVAAGQCPQEMTITRTWTATDDCGNQDSCDQAIQVVDSTGPTLNCNAPATITPPDGEAPISFTATATDNCDGGPVVEVTGFNCTATYRRKAISKLESCVVEFDGPTVTILDSGGVGDQISWTIEGTDACGNPSQKTCQVEVAKPKR
jgi:hypothetical protein